MRSSSYIEKSVRADQLRELVSGNDLSFLMEAHDALSAAVAQTAGFRGLWASGLSISSTLGFRDANEASWTSVVDTVERIVDAVDVPVLVDADSGFGNFNNARIVASKLMARGAAGLCLEDKQFPKMNSFVGDRHELADIQEFCGKLRAIKDTTGDGLVLVARLEALIAGQGMGVALERAHAYAAAGADAVLIHSRQSTADEVLEFARLWDNRLPLVIVPTKYHRTPASAFREARISAVIWANHAMRAAVAAMQQVCTHIHQHESVSGVEGEIATLETVFGLLDYEELSAAEATYLPGSEAGVLQKMGVAR